MNGANLSSLGIKLARARALPIYPEETPLKFNPPNAGPTMPPETSTRVAESSRAKAETLLHKAHRVLVEYLPGAALPDELSKVRAMLDAHMFGRDRRACRDDVVEVARQIDQLLPARVR
jgi:hypothetical protein